MSRPSITTPPCSPARRCSATSTCRTPETTATFDAACETSGVRIAVGHVLAIEKYLLRCRPARADQFAYRPPARRDRRSAIERYAAAQRLQRDGAVHRARIDVDVAHQFRHAARQRALARSHRPVNRDDQFFHRVRCFQLERSNPFESALDFAHRIAQHDGPPVRAAHRVLRFSRVRRAAIPFSSGRAACSP